jgi:signal transduction histidine kinase
MRKLNPFFEMRVALQRALVLLDPHFTEIQAAWRKRLASLGVKEDVCDILSPLMLQAQRQNLWLPTLGTYRLEIERQGEILEKSGVPEAEIAAAYTFYLESCLPYLLGPEHNGKDPILALARLVATSQFLTLSSFSTERVANRRKLQERDRQDFSRDLHDDIGHSLLVIKLYLEMMTTDLKRGKIAMLRSKLEETMELVSYAVASVRRLILGQGPALLAQYGFLLALKIYARQFTQRAGIQVSLEETGLPKTLPSSYETALYRVLKGALSNVIQHSKAKQVKITLGSRKESLLFMSFEDDGIGFDLSSTLPARMFGLTAMRERIEALGGKFHIESWPRRPGTRKHGTRIEVRIPLFETIE